MRVATVRPRRCAARLIGCLVLALTAGCSSLSGSGVKPPDVAIEGVSLTRPGIVSQDLTLSLRVDNRMARDIAIDSVSVDLDVNGQRLGSGMLLQAFTLPAAGALTIDVPVKVRTADLLDALVRMGNDSKLSYTLDGRLRLAGADEGSVAFGDKGELAVPRSLPSRLGT